MLKRYSSWQIHTLYGIKGKGVKGIKTFLTFESTVLEISHKAKKWTFLQQIKTFLTSIFKFE